MNDLIESKGEQRILVRAPNWIGDQVLAYPFFFFLRKAFPKAKIAVACVSWVQSLQFRAQVDEVIVLPKPFRPGWKAKLDALREGGALLKKSGPWDLAISLPNSFSSAVQLYLSGARVRVGYNAEGRGFLLNRPVPWKQGESLHRSEAYLKLLPKRAQPERSVQEFWGVQPENELDPAIPGFLSAFDAKAEWPGSQPVEAPKGPYWVLAPGSVAESRRWPEEYFVSLAREIQRKTGWTGVVVGGPAEAPLGARLCGNEEVKLLDFTAQGAVIDYWKLFANARFTVSNDSGLAHVASLCGSPVQVVWGAGNPGRTEPLGPGKVRVTMNPVDCWPCERNTCDQQGAKKLSCLRGIRAETLWEEIQKGIKPA